MSYTIGVMIGNANSPHTIETLHGIREAAEKTGANIICFTGIHSSYFYKDYFEKEHKEDYDYQSTCVFDYDKLCHVDALIVSFGSMTVFMSERELKEFQRRILGTPTVYLETKTEGKNVRYLTEDNYAGMRLIMDHMIKFHGYQKILYLSGPKGNFDADERLRGYREAMIEAGFPLDKSMIAYGDFSENVETQINKLLDLNPDAEAIVCANDMMALASYNVINAREENYKKALKAGDKDGIEKYKKYEIGESSEHSVAITGFDNVPDAINVEPALTTIVQSPYSHGFMAVHTAISLIENESETESVMAVPKPIYRQSCGCKHTKHLEFPSIEDRYKLYPEQYAATAAEIFINGMIPVELSDAVSDEVYKVIYEIILKHVKNYIGISGKKLSSEEMFEDVKELLNGSVSKYVPRMTFVTSFNDFMVSLLKNAKRSKEREILVDAQAKISDYVYSKLFAETREDLMTYRHRTWFMPLISRDMANYLDSPKDMYYDAMIKIKTLGVGDAYIFVADETITHRKGERWECPKELKLVAKTEHDEVVSYDPDEAQVVSSENVINDIIKGNDVRYEASVLNLYSGEYQYGIMVAKVAPEDLLSLYCASIQISTALKYCETAREQRRAQKELHYIIREVEDKNEILRSLSEFDELTGCYNRRGFLEKGLSLIRANVGREACIVYADLDHLKEINDKYGHSEGDFAIENIAKNIKNALPDSAILARLGGDEFVALFLIQPGMDEELLVKNIANTSVSFNAMSAKPYYIECSSGYKTFMCEENTPLEEVMGLADQLLYEAKERRRKTIVKKFTIV